MFIKFIHNYNLRKNLLNKKQNILLINNYFIYIKLII